MICPPPVATRTVPSAPTTGDCLGLASEDAPVQNSHFFTPVSLSRAWTLPSTPTTKTVLSDPRATDDLIDADIAILSRGSFSYAAGVLSEGIVIADPYYPPQDGWLVCDEAGDFDAA